MRGMNQEKRKKGCEKEGEGWGTSWRDGGKGMKE